ncbi:MAG TPA: hypothetical protein VMV08_04925 [Gaiellaceae bacterium]|nr:hypothetical protein [Gaiellaceae bacterium]
MATALGTAVMALFAASVPLALLAHQLGGGSSLILVIAFVVVGTVVARHQPRNPIGWSMLAAAGFLALSADASLYSVFDYRQRHGSLPLGPLAVLLQPTWAPAIFLFALSIVLFPDGKLPSGRWRWPIGLLVALGTAWLAGAFAIAATTILGHRIQIEPSGDLVAIDHARGGFAWWSSVQSTFFIVLALVGLAWLASRVPAYRHSSGERRQQLKWLLCGGIAAVIGGVATVLFSNSGGALGLFGRVAVVGVLGLPLGIGIGILKYRLYEIDRLISRTLSYTLLTALLVGVFTGLVLLTTRVLPFSSPVGVAASTLVAAALVNPLRGRLQRVVDRRFNRARYDADALVAAFSTRLRDAVDLEAVTAGLLETAARALEPAHLSVWLRGERGK